LEGLEASRKQPATAFLKTRLLREAKGTLVAVVLPGDRDINEAKLRKVLGTTEVKFANEGDFAAAGSVPGFSGPIGLKVRTLIDRSVDARPYIAGANQRGAVLRYDASG